MKYIDMASGELGKSWLIYLLRGVLILFFAAALLLWPQIKIADIGYLFGVYVLLDGAIAIWAGMIGWQAAPIMFGMVSIAMGSWAFFPDEDQAVFYLSLIAVWALMRSLFELSVAVDIHLRVVDDWGLILSGLLSLLLGMISINIGMSHAIQLLWVLVAYAMIIGATWIVIAVNLRHADKYNHIGDGDKT